MILLWLFLFFCRYYSIRVHNFHKLIETDKIVVKTKPNPEFDKYILDNEEKDWIDFLSNDFSIKRLWNIDCPMERRY